MTQRQQGFTLLEVLVAVAVASVLAAALFTSFYQSNRLVNDLDDYMDVYANAILIDQQMTKDVSGAFIPVQATPPPEPAKKPPTAPPEATKQKKKKPLLKDPFVAKNKESNVDLLSFITNNPMRVYWGAKTGGPKPSVARVVYTLEQNKSASKKKKSYTLYRQEGNELALAPYTKKESKIERYPLADNIKSCKLSFMVSYIPESEGKKEQGGAAPQKQAEPEEQIKIFNDWIIGTDKKDIRTKLKLPDEVTVTLELWDARQRRARKFEFVILVPAIYQEPKPEPPAPQPAKPGTPPRPGVRAQTTVSIEKKEVLVSGANTIMQNMQRLFG